MSYAPIATSKGPRWVKVLGEFTHSIEPKAYDFLIVEDEGAISVTHKQSGKRFALLPDGTPAELLMSEAHKAITAAIEKHGIAKVRRAMDMEPAMDVDV